MNYIITETEKEEFESFLKMKTYDNLNDLIETEFPNGFKRDSSLVNPYYLFKNMITGKYHIEILTSGMTSAPGYYFCVIPNFTMTKPEMINYLSQAISINNNHELHHN